MMVRPPFAPGNKLFSGFLLLLLIFTLWGCADEAPETETQEEPFVSHGESSDFVDDSAQGKNDSVITSTFSQNHVVSENFFIAEDAIDGDDLQRFFEETPYGTRCWLADETINGERAADAIVKASREKGINPIIMVARMQVEKSHISQTSRPSRRSIDFAFGCGCPDYQDCSPQFRGLPQQISCAAETLRKLHDQSDEGIGNWNIDKTRKTLDGIYVTPENHATAALYAYTPWVLRGRGGNWLVWNITRKFALHFERMGVIDLDDPLLSDPFIGSYCEDDTQCLFRANGQQGFCNRYLGNDNIPGGFCSILCEGTCPDRTGHAYTFCTEVREGLGACVSQSRAENSFCEELPGTTAQTVDRHIGNSNSRHSQREVCLP